MADMLSFFISACILWFLLVLFNEGSHYEIQQQQAITISLVVAFAGLLLGLAVTAISLPGGWLLVSAGKAAVLYIAVDKFCGYSTRTTWKIVISFVGVHLIWGMIAAFLR